MMPGASVRRLPEGAVGICLVWCLLAPAPAWGGPLEIRSDARVELIGLLQHLSGDPMSRQRPGGAAGRALERFAPFRSHPAVAGLAALRSSGFSGHLTSQYVLYLSTPGLQESYPVPDMFVRGAGGRERLDGWMADVRRFVHDTGFADWYAETGPERLGLEEALRRSIGVVDLESSLAAYLGVRSWDRIVVVPSAFFVPGGPSAWVLEEKPGLPDVYVITGPRWERGRPVFGRPEEVAAAVWPEAVFSIAYVMARRCRPLLDTVEGLCEAIGYPYLEEPEDCVENQWVLGVVSRLIGRVFGSEAEEDYMSRMRQILRPEFLRKVRAVLADYEADRRRYPTLLDIESRLLAPFQRDGLAPACPDVDWTRLGESLYASTARFYLDARLAGRPDNGLLKKRAQLKAHFGDLEGSEADTRSALELSERDLEAWAHLGVLLHRKGSLAEAKQAFERSLRSAAGQNAVDPSLLADILSSRASLLAELGDFGGARADLERALETAPPGWSRRQVNEARLRQLGPAGRGPAP